MKGQKWKLITWADLASFWLYSLSICFNLLLVCKEKKGEGSVRKRYADGQVEGHKERQGSEIQSSVRKCTETHYPPNLTILSHTHTHTFVLTSASWQCVPVEHACGPLAPRHSQRSCVPAGSDGHSAQWAPLPFDPLPTIHHLTRRGATVRGGGIKMLLPISYRVRKKKARETFERSWETKQGGDRIEVNGDCCWKFSERCSSLLFSVVSLWEASQLEAKAVCF